MGDSAPPRPPGLSPLISIPFDSSFNSECFRFHEIFLKQVENMYNISQVYRYIIYMKSRYSYFPLPTCSYLVSKISKRFRSAHKSTCAHDLMCVEQIMY
ncbi:hypothetical protein VN97_g6198 [Penicillium thymicola]|uniref:Uncharacterized protein n=1 Tax=Penicillium thymicola TaxID=293382 RepID=A0AAI9THC7_PENTH|nr:hypothetical protein VN97_g6198 [Penicillium thymicola]